MEPFQEHRTLSGTQDIQACFHHRNPFQNSCKDLRISGPFLIQGPFQELKAYMHVSIRGTVSGTQEFFQILSHFNHAFRNLGTPARTLHEFRHHKNPFQDLMQELQKEFQAHFYCKNIFRNLATLSITHHSKRYRNIHFIFRNSLITLLTD